MDMKNATDDHQIMRQMLKKIMCIQSSMAKSAKAYMYEELYSNR